MSEDIEEPSILGQQIYLAYLDSEDVKQADIDGAYDAGMIRLGEMIDGAIYLGWSPRKITLAHWDFRRQCFIVRIVQGGDSRFVNVFHPAQTDSVNIFIPVAVKGFLKYNLELGE